MKKMNKKANIPVTILVIGVLAVCGLAILSFYLNGSRIVKDISDISVIETVKLEKEKFDFYTENLGFSQEDAVALVGVKEDESYGKHLRAKKGNLEVIYQIP